MALPASEPLARAGTAAQHVETGASISATDWFRRGDRGAPKVPPVFKAAGDAADIGTVNVPNLRPIWRIAVQEKYGAP